MADDAYNTLVYLRRSRPMNRLEEEAMVTHSRFEITSWRLVAIAP